MKNFNLVFSSLLPLILFEMQIMAKKKKGRPTAAAVKHGTHAKCKCSTQRETHQPWGLGVCVWNKASKCSQELGK